MNGLCLEMARWARRCALLALPLLSSAAAAAQKPTTIFTYDPAGHLTQVINLMSDPANCGSLGNACPASPGGACCTGGACGYMEGGSCRQGEAVMVALAPLTASVGAGGTFRFTATLRNTVSTAIAWSVNGVPGGNAAVGTVDSRGLFKAPAAVPAPAIVTLTARSLADTSASASALVTISPAITVTVTPSSALVVPGQAQQFTAAVQNTTSTSVTWSVNGVAGGNAVVGTITSSGLYTPPPGVPSPSTLQVTAVSNADTTKSGSATVTVVATPLVTLSPASASVQVAKTLQFAVSVRNAASGVTWSVNGIAGGNSTVGTISSAGLYTAPAAVPSPAAVLVTAVSTADPTRSASAVVTVTAIPVTVKISPPSATVGMGKSLQFTATVQNSTPNTVTWSVNGFAGGSPSVGTITSAGFYMAPASVSSPTTVTVTATWTVDPTVSAAASVTVTNASGVLVSVYPVAASVATGQTQQFTATVQNTTNTGVSWKVNGVAGGNSTVGTISSAGLYKAPSTVPKPAAVTVSAVSSADSSKSGSGTVTVVSPISVSVSPTSKSLTVGQTQQFTATVSNSTNTSVAWYVNGVAGGNSTVGTVTSTGLYTAPNAVPSPATESVTAVSAADSSKSGSASVSLKAGTVSVSLSPSSMSVPVTQSFQLWVAVSNASNPAVSWSVNGIAGGNSTLGTVSADGIYTAPAAIPSPATVTVKATSVADSTKSASMRITIVSLPPVEVFVDPDAVSLRVGESQQFRALVFNAADLNVTWFVNGILGGDESVGLIDPSGLYTAPSVIPATRVTVSAVANADGTTSGTTQVTVRDAGSVTVSIDPAYDVLIGKNSNTWFTATVLNISDPSVTWFVNGIAGGDETVGFIGDWDSSGSASYSPAGPGRFTITAVSNADSTAWATAVLDSGSGYPPVVLSIGPESATVLAGQTVQFTSQATGPEYYKYPIIWWIDGADAYGTLGTIGNSGWLTTYTAPAVAPADPIWITAYIQGGLGIAWALITVLPAPPATIAPTTAQVGVGQMQGFVPTFLNLSANTSSRSALWYVDGIQGGNSAVGTVDAYGNFTAPAAMPSPAVVTVTAVSTADSSLSAAAVVTITPIPPIVVTVFWSDWFFEVGKTASFTCSVGNAQDTSVTWSVNGIPGGNSVVGSIDGNGRYTAPAAVPEFATVTVTATSTEDNSKSNSATITVTPPLPILVEMNVPLSPLYNYVPSPYDLFKVKVNGFMQMYPVVENTPDKAVTWCVNGITGGTSTLGTIGYDGVYWAPPVVPNPATVTVMVVLNSDPTIWFPILVEVTP